jgi:hypothetical protein
VKLVEIVLRRGEGKRENDRRDKPKIYCKHLSKYHNVSIPLYIDYMLIKFLKKILNFYTEKLK